MLAQTGFLSDASEGLSDMLEALATSLQLDDGEVLFEQSDPGDALFAVIDGALEISVLSPGGRKLVLDVMHPGALVGEIALFDPGPRTATVTALAPSTLLRLRREDLLREIGRHPDLAIDMIRLAGSRMRWMSTQLSDHVFLPMPARLARKLLYLTTVMGEGGDQVEMSQAQLAEFVGATREAVSKTLGEWKRAGVVSASRSALTIRDRAALGALADYDMI